MISNFVKNHNTEFYSDCISLHCHQQWMRVSFIPHPCLNELSFGLFGILLSDFLSCWCILDIRCGFGKDILSCYEPLLCLNNVLCLTEL